MEQATNQRQLVVTAQQYQKGYVVYQAASGDMVSRPYTLVRKLDDGNYVVVDPHEEYLSHYALSPAEIEIEERQGSTTPIPWADPKDFAAASRSTLQELQAVQALAREAADPDQRLPQRHTGVFGYDSAESKLAHDQRRYPGGFAAKHAREVEHELWPTVMKALSDGRRYVVQVETTERDDTFATRREKILVDQIVDPLPGITTDGVAMVVRTTRATVLLLDPRDAHIGEFVRADPDGHTWAVTGHGHQAGDLVPPSHQYKYHDVLRHTAWQQVSPYAWVRVADPTPGPGESDDHIWTGPPAIKP